MNSIIAIRRQDIGGMGGDTSPDGSTDGSNVRRSRSHITRCPHCNSPALIRNNIEVDALHRDIYLYCANTDCGHSWKAQLAFVYSIAVPVNTGTNITLPVSPRQRANPIAHAGRATDPPPKVETEPVT